MSKILKINLREPDVAVVKKMAKVIRDGGIVIAPTHTVYAIFADALNPEAIKKVLQFKKRKKDKGFDLTLYPEKKIFEYIQPNPLINKILEKFSSQPLSFATPRKKSLPNFLNPEYQTAAFHFFFSELDKELFKILKTPLIGTSANLSGLPETHSVEKTIEYFKHTFGSDISPDLILDGGKIPFKKPSAIIEIKGEKIKILREGDRPLAEMEKEIKYILPKKRESSRH